MRGWPGIAPRSSSSRLGLVAAVSETDSPSQLSPLVSHSTWTIRRSASPWPVKSTARLHAPTASAAHTSSPRRALGRSASAATCSAACRGGAASPSRLVTRPAVRQPRERVRDRGPLGADELAEQAVRERQRHADAAGLDPAPAPCEVPEQQRQPHLEARLRGDRALDVEVGGARAGARQQRARDLRPRLDALRERVVEQREPASAAACARPIRVSSRSSTRAVNGCSRSPSPTSSVAVRSPTRTSTLSTPSSTSRPGPWPTSAKQRVEVARRRPARRTRRPSRPGGRRAACAGRARRRGRRRRSSR